jgi:hypothetical protein
LAALAIEELAQSLRFCLAGQETILQPVEEATGFGSLKVPPQDEFAGSLRRFIIIGERSNSL